MVDKYEQSSTKVKETEKKKACIKSHVFGNTLMLYFLFALNLEVSLYKAKKLYR